MILLIDNYDSFTYNLSQEIETQGYTCVVRRNDEVSIQDIERLGPKKLIISPGPGNPDDAGICLEAIARFAPLIPVLGVCLGHQSIGQVYGGRVERAPAPLHGKTSPIRHNERGLFRGVENPFQAARYHSLIVAKDSIPETLEIHAETDDGLVMALKHRDYETYGLQFHPESIATEQGSLLLRNFLRNT